MPGERYVLLGLARAQSRWFLEVARWSTSGALPAEFLKVVSAEELRARLQSGRAFSAVLIDASLPACDRDLVELARSAGCVVIVVDHRPTSAQWPQLGVAATLPPDFAREDLFAELRAVAQPVSRGDAVPTEASPRHAAPAAWRGRVIAVVGAGGTGRSTVAMALAAGLAADARDRGLVVLADLALRAHQGLLHDAGDLVPGLSELVEAHRNAVLAPPEIRKLCFEVGGQGYDLLLGLRRPRDWAALRPRTFGAALDGLRRCYRLVVTDTDADVEGEEECGSLEVEERNLLARISLQAADLVVVVGLGGVVGTPSHVRVLQDLLDLGLSSERLFPLINRAPRHPRLRAELSRSLVELLDEVAPDTRLAAAPLCLPERRRLDDALRDDGRIPAGFATAVAEPTRALLDRLPARGDDDAWPSVPHHAVAVAPGSLAEWSALSGEPG